MEDKNELSDIVLEKEDDKSQKAKRILLIVAVLIVVFLITIVIMKVTNDSKSANTPKLTLPPEPITKSIDTQVKQEDALFKKVDIEEADEDKKESLEEMVKSLKEKEKKKIKEEITQKVEKEIPAPVAEKKEIPKEVEKVKKAPKPVKKVKNKISSLATTGVYVQVGATSRLSPDKKFLKTITSKNYDYKLLPINVKGKKVTKILIGPYKSTKEAKAVLADIKSKINKDAFIYRVK